MELRHIDCTASTVIAGLGAPSSDKKRVGQWMGEIVIVLSASGHLIAFLVIQRGTLVSVRGGKSIKAEPFGSGLDAFDLMRGDC